MATKERSIEVKVGALILLALGILAAFILILGGLTFERTYTVYVDFDNPGGVQTGAPVRMAGVKVGKVEEIAFLGGRLDPKTNRRSQVRTKISIQRKVKDSVHDDADFFVTTQGLLGEQYLAIAPGSPERPPLADDAIVRGIDPPRLDLFLAKAYELMDTTVNGLRNNRELISDIATNTAGLLRNLNGVLEGNKDRIQRTFENVEKITEEAKVLTEHARTNLVDNPKLQRTIDNVDRLSSEIARDTPALLKDAREATANLNRVSGTLGSPEETEKLKRALANVEQLAERANATVADAQGLVTKIKKGEGTVGALVMDEQIYDDVQEMVRDLKHNPWKFLWKQ